MRRGTLALAAAWTFFMHVSVASAAPFDLAWSAPEGCPTREEIIAASRAALGEGESTAPPELYVHGTVTDDGGAFVVHLRITDKFGADLGERHVRFQDRRCEAIEEPTSLLVAMMIAVARSREPADERPPREASKPAKPPVEQVKNRRAPSRPPPRAPKTNTPMTLGASAVASLGVLPNVGLGGALRWTASFARVLLGVEGSFETSWGVPAASGEATFRLFDLAALAGVRVVRWHGFELIPLLELRGGILTAAAAGFPARYDTTRVVGVVAAGALARIPLGSAIHFEILPDVRVPLAHDEFAVREGGELIRIHATAPIEARLALGVGWSF